MISPRHKLRDVDHRFDAKHFGIRFPNLALQKCDLYWFPSRSCSLQKCDGNPGYYGTLAQTLSLCDQQRAHAAHPWVARQEDDLTFWNGTKMHISRSWRTFLKVLPVATKTYTLATTNSTTICPELTPLQSFFTDWAWNRCFAFGKTFPTNPEFTAISRLLRCSRFRSHWFFKLVLENDRLPRYLYNRFCRRYPKYDDEVHAENKLQFLPC